MFLQQESGQPDNDLVVINRIFINIIVIAIMTRGEGGVPLAGKWSTFHISATHCRQLWPQVTPTLMPTTTLSYFPFYTFERRQQASKGNTISKLNWSNTNIMTAMIFLVIIDNLLLTLAAQLPI